MRITIGGVPGSGKSTVAKMVAEKLGYDFYSIGSIRRKLASERGLTIDQFNSLPENTDKMADDYQKMLGETKDNFVVEGRLAFHFIPKSIKIYFDCSLDVAAERIFNDRRPSERNYEALEESLKALKSRMKNDSERYNRLYNVDSYDKKNFDYVIDTSSISIEKVVEKVLDICTKAKK